MASAAIWVANEAAERLTLMAGPETLGVLRQALPADILARVAMEAPKRLVNGPEADIRTHRP